MADDVIFNKCAIIERCVRRVREEYAGDPSRLHDDLTRQDSIVLNIQRAARAAIDLAMHLVRTQELGIPQQSRDAFTLLEETGALPEDLATPLKKMVGFRTIAVHDYRALNLRVVQAIVEGELAILLRFSAWALQQGGEA